MKSHRLNDVEITIGIEILKFIESKKEIGASNVELLVYDIPKSISMSSLNLKKIFFFQEKFESKALIKKCLDIFNKQNMVMRTGVVDFTFVHWIYTSAWLITTYHLKRLNKEASTSQPHKLMRIGNSDENVSIRPNRFDKVTVDQQKGFPNRSDPQR